MEFLPLADIITDRYYFIGQLAMNIEITPLGNIKSAKDIGKIVARYRKIQRLTQIELAGLAQTGTRFISELENGKSTIQFDKAMHVLDLLGIDILAKER